MKDNKKPILGVVRGYALRQFDALSFEQCDRYNVQIIHSTKQDLHSNMLSFVKLNAKPVVGFDPVSLLSRNYTPISWVYLKHLEKYLKEVDIVNTIETYFFLSRQCAQICKKLRKPLVISVSQNIANHPTNFLFPYSSNMRTVLKRADLYVAISQKAEAYLRSFNITESKILVIPPGINLDNFKGKYRPTSNAPLRILFIGNLTEIKGIPELLAACLMLHKAHVKFELWICGSGPLLPLVLDYQNRIPIKYVGTINYTDIPQLYAQCDIFCLPSKDGRRFGMTLISEQFGFVLLEAMASGLPIVTTNCGAIPEVVGPENIVVPQDSIQHLFSALFALTQDENRRKSLSVSNIKRAEECFDSKKQCKKFQDALDTLL